MHVWKNLQKEKNVFNLIYVPYEFQIDIFIQLKSMAFWKVCTFIPIWGAIWVFSPGGEGGPQDPPSYKNIYSPRGQELSAKVSRNPLGRFRLSEKKAKS